MIRISAKIYVALLSLLMLLVGSSILVSCIEEDDGGIAPADDYVDVSIKISAGDASGISVTRADEDPNAVDGEFMNSLCIFIVDSSSGTIEAKLQPDLTGTDADNGDLEEWQSGKIRLSSGDKIIYAFANWETADNEGGDWAKLIAKEEGESIIESDLMFTIDDPASKVDITNGKYIPMSGKTKATVNDFTEIEVGLERLVGKVTIAVQGEVGTNAADVTLGTLTFSGWPDQVSLFSDITPTGGFTYSYENGGYKEEFDQTIIYGKTEGTPNVVTVATFYVNETVNKTTGFDITLDTDRYGGTSYTASTLTTDIPRNYILPITLTLDQNVLDLGVTAWTAPLGIEEVPYSNIEINGSTLIVSLLDVTSTFKLTPQMLYQGEPIETATWEWTYYNTTDGSVATYDDDDGSVTVTSLTATPGYEYGFKLVANWTTTSTSGVTSTHSRTYTIYVRLVEGWPVFTNSRIWQSQLMGNELINMTTLGN